jgi:hypothetical protein
MAKPIVHAESSAKRWGGTPEDYFPIHDLMDKSKGAIPDNRHRALTHNSWFLSTILELIHMPSLGWHGPILKRPSDGKEISVREIGEQHILEDFKGEFIPTAQDYLEEMEIKHWMNNGAYGQSPSSHKKIAGTRVSTKEIRVD